METFLRDGALNVESVVTNWLTKKCPQSNEKEEKKKKRMKKDTIW